MASLFDTSISSPEFVFDRDLHKVYPEVVSGEGCYLTLKDGRRIFDACGGAAVTCLGNKNQRVKDAMIKQIDTGITYLSSSTWASGVVSDFCEELVRGTDGKMAKVYLAGSGSEAMEAAIKLSRQYFCEQNPQSPRIKIIARERSYHGNTLGALSLSGFFARRKLYIPFLMKGVHFISSCYQYRQQKNGESDKDFVARKAKELDDKFLKLGPDTVMGFIAEPVVGAALGSVPSPPGYLKAMRDVCHKHGALFILDEVMCGMGRTGYLHAWQAEDVVPDIQVVAKGLGGGYQPISALFISEKVVNVFEKGSGIFNHGLTFQSMPLQAATSMEVQRIIREGELMENVSKQGEYLGEQLKDKLRGHPNVGDIRGRGLFWGLEFVKDKATKEPFDHEIQVAYGIKDLGISEFDIAVYPSTGCENGVNGDHIILAPAYIVTKEEVDLIVTKVCLLVNTFFSRLPERIIQKEKNQKDTKMKKKFFLALFSLLFYNMYNVSLYGFFSLHFVFSLCIGYACFFICK